MLRNSWKFFIYVHGTVVCIVIGACRKLKPIRMEVWEPSSISSLANEHSTMHASYRLLPPSRKLGLLDVCDQVCLHRTARAPFLSVEKRRPTLVQTAPFSLFYSAWFVN